MAEVTIYGVIFSHFTRKVLMACEEKGIDYENEPIYPAQLPEDLARHTPMKKIPFARIGDRWLADSRVINEYLEGLYPEPALCPSAPWDRARARWYEEYIDGWVVPNTGPKLFYQRVVKPVFLGKTGDESIVQEAINTDLPPIFDYLEGEINAREFMVSNSLSSADISIGSWFVNIRDIDIEIDTERWPNLSAYVDRLHRRPSLKKLIGSQAEFFQRLRESAGA